MQNKSSLGFIMLDTISKLADEDIPDELTSELPRLYEQMGELRKVAPFYVANAAIEIIPPGFEFSDAIDNCDQVQDVINASVARFGNIAFRLLGYKSLAFASDVYIKMLAIRIGSARNLGDLNHLVVRALSMHRFVSTQSLQAVIKGVAGSYLHVA